MNLHLMRIYAASPLRVQQMAILAFGWYWRYRRFGRAFHRLVQEY